MVILRSVSILVYLPMLTISGILTGAFTGLCAWKVAQIVCRELGIKNLDEIDEPAERRAIADI